MIPETIHYTDLDGKPAQKEWYFALDKAEIAEMKIRHEGPGKGSLEDYLDRIIKEQDNNKLLDNFKAILFKSVGVRKGNYIAKNQDILDEFVGSGAYEAMFMRMLGDATYAANLINGIIPKDLAKAVAEKQAEIEGFANAPHSDEELLAMTDEQFFTAAGGSNPMRWEPRFLMLAAKRKNAA